jgi:hypothetical protein
VDQQQVVDSDEDFDFILEYEHSSESEQHASDDGSDLELVAGRNDGLYNLN